MRQRGPSVLLERRARGGGLDHDDRDDQQKGGDDEPGRDRIVMA